MIFNACRKTNEGQQPARRKERESSCPSGMEPIEEQTRMLSSQGKEDEGSRVSGEIPEGLALLRWQREDRRISCHEGG